MTPTLLRYPLVNGFVEHWLVAGPQLRPAPPAHAATDLALMPTTSGVTEPVVDLGPLTAPAEGEKPLTWRYYRTLDDHLVDLTAVYAEPSQLHGWAYAQILAPAAGAVTLVVSGHGPAAVWVNGQPLAPLTHLNPRVIQSTSLTAEFQAGANEILVRFEAEGVGPVRHALALRLPDLSGAEILLPTNIEHPLLAKRHIAEDVAEHALLDRYVIGQLTGERYEKNESVRILFAPDLKGTSKITLRLQNAVGMIYQEATPEVKADFVMEMANTVPLLVNGLHHLVVMPVAHEYYQQNLRFQRHDPFFYVKSPFTVRGGPDVPTRAKEALADFASRRGGHLYTELAKMATAQWEKVAWKNVQTAIDGIQADTGPDAVFDLLGLLGFLLRYPSKKKQAHLKEVRPALEAAALAFRYWPAEQNGLSPAGGDFVSEHRQLAYHTAEILAGQLWPAAVFGVSGQTGAWHREHGESLALPWLRQRGALGLQEWNSPESMDAVVTCVTHLLDLAESEPVAELSAILMDKLMFILAVNSFQGAYAGTQGNAVSESVLSARLSGATGLARLLWGQGNFTQHMRGTVSLACCREYQLPDLIRQIATKPVDVIWNLERNVRPAAAGEVSGPWAWEVNTATYKTKNFMLSCAQDYQPGTPGKSEHIWQATLGPDAVMFVNHPTTLALDDAHQPNLWVGNGVLPRAVQWGDVLMSVHQLPADDWLGLTHAYFPARVFDEHAFQGQWAFARTGDGYLALAAARGFTQVTTGPTAFRELRSPGLSNVWLVHMGQSLLDGSFEDFQKKILALDVQWEDAAVRVTTLRGDKLAFGWTGPLVVNGDEQSVVNPRHIENPYCVAELPATQMDLVYEGEGVRLTFS